MARDVNEGGRGVNRGWRQWLGGRRRPESPQGRPGRMESGTLNPLEYHGADPDALHPSTALYPSSSLFPSKGI